MDPITKAYLTMLEESDKSSGIVGSTKSQVGKIFGDETTLPDSDCTTDNVDLETPEEAPAELTSKGATGEPKPMKKTKTESLNPFDALYNRVLNEEGQFGFSTEEDNTLEPPDEGVEGESDFEMGEESDESEESDEVTLTIDRETAQKLVDILNSVLGEGEEEEEEQTEDEMFDDSDSESDVEDLESSDEDEDPFKESVDAEELGHALVKDLDKGHLTNKKSKEVKGAVPVSKKSAQSSTIKGADGKIQKHSTEGAISKLTGKNNNVGGVKVGKGLFDQ
jgi:hypothetical protein